jgi:hypothetical protein
METQTADELLINFVARIQDLKRLVSQPCIANMKERRQNPTQMFPIPDNLRNLLPHYTQPIDAVMDDDVGFVEDLWSLLLEPFQRPCDYGSTRAIPFKVTPKCAGPGEMCHNDYFNEAMRSVRRRDKDYIHFNELMGVLGKQREWVMATAGRLCDNQFFGDVMNVLASDLSDSSIRDSFDRKYRNHAPTARLRTKVVEQRCELRSYCYDEDVCSAVVGAMLHSTIHPQNKTQRSSLRYNKVWQIRGKNILQKEIKVRQGEFVMEIYGDVSSFTASIRNIWTTLITVAAHMESKGLAGENVTLNMLFRGRTIFVKLDNLIRMYVFLNFRRLIYDELNYDAFANEGGMLGIAGVNTIANIVFASLQMALSLSVARYPAPVSYSPQNGGDDFHSVVKSRSEYELERLMCRVKNTIEKYIGSFSEFDVWTIQPHACPHHDFYSKSLFCKKTIRVALFTSRLGELSMRWQSQFSLPLYAILLEGRDFRNSPDFDEQAQTFQRSLESTMPWVPDKQLLIDTFITLFSLLHGPVDVTKVLEKSFTRIPTSWSITKDGFTEEAEMTILSADLGVGPDGLHLYEHGESRELVLSRRGKIRSVYGRQNDTDLYVTCTRAQMQDLVVVPAVIIKRELMSVNAELLRRIFVELMECRTLIAEYLI